MLYKKKTIESVVKTVFKKILINFLIKKKYIYTYTIINYL